MRGLAVAGWNVVTSAGVGARALAERVGGRELSAVPADPGTTVGGLYPDPLPSPRAHALTSFDVRAHLGRRGSSSYDRATGLAVVCCQGALEAAAVDLDDAARQRMGVALGTSVGSFKSTSDYTRETLTQERPYLVNPLLFPNTVMNCAAGQVAIRFGLRGVNATIAGGGTAFLNALRYAANTVERGYADAMLTGAVEEYTPHRAWAGQLTGAGGRLACGEGAGMFVLTGISPPGWVGGRPQAAILAVATGFAGGGGSLPGRALRGCVERALAQAEMPAARVSTVYTGEVDETDQREYGPACRALGHRPRRVLAKRMFGECDAASAAIALAVSLTEDATPGRLCLLTARNVDGAVGAALVERYTDVGTDRG